MDIFDNIKQFIKFCGEGNLNGVKGVFSILKNSDFSVLYQQFNANNEIIVSNNLTPLMMSTNQISKESYHIMEFLLENGANPNFKCNTISNLISPLHSTIANSFESMPFRMQMEWEELEVIDDDIKLEITGLELLIKYGAKINIKDDRGKTPLDWSIKFEHKPAFNYLKSLGAKLGEEISNKEDEILEKKIKESIHKNYIYHIVISDYQKQNIDFEIKDEDIPDF